VFFVFTFIAGVASWLLVLAHESRKVAQEESLRQTQLLMQEIEAHKRTDAQLQRAKELAEAANLAKSRYVTSMSHELRTPLNTVLGYAQLLQRDDGIPAHRRDAVDAIRRSGEHLAGLIDGLLDIAKIEAGKLHLHRGEVFFRELLDEMVSMFRLQAAAKGVEFRFEPQDELPELVYADERRVRQILINLLSNAIKFTERGHVALRVRYRRQLAELEIEDTGIGIAPEDLECVFQPFERGRLAARAGAGGTGLGLTISRLLAEIMGGQIQVRSRPGAGSTFTVTLMLTQVSTPTVRRDAHRRVRGYLGPPRTLIVTDDEEAHRDFIAGLLEPLGFVVLGAGDAQTCIELAATHHVDLFLLDIALPGANGWQLAARLREGDQADAPIIMVSANAYESQRESSGQSAHDDFIVKPVDFWQLLEKLQRHLRIEWMYDDPTERSAVPVPVPERLPSDMLDALWTLGESGHVRGIHRKLDELERCDDTLRPWAQYLRELIKGFQLNRYMKALEAARSHVR
jgi:signal transduction histidine kinase/ActR/RegA family two-component response regulator